VRVSYTRWVLRSFTDVLALWTPIQFSRVMGVPYTTACAMYQRESVGSAHWSRLIEVTKARGEVLTADMLIQFRNVRAAKTHPRRRRQAGLRPRGRPRSKSHVQLLPVQ
jgi:hypothetical protein